MELDTKQRVLLALYSEYQNDIPDMKSITHELLEIEKPNFNIAIEKLYNEGYITDALIKRSLGSDFPSVNIQFLKLTRDGIHYIESKLNINYSLSNIEKVKYVSRKLGEWGNSQFKDIIAKIAAELLKKEFT